MVMGAIFYIFFTIVAITTLYNVNVANAQLAHVPSMNAKTITSGLGNMSKTIGKTLNMTGSKISSTNQNKWKGILITSSYEH
jgi:hypothetical protein